LEAIQARNGVRLDGIDYYNEQMAPDEADYLSDGSLELVRRVISDKARTGIGVLLEVKRLAKPDAVKVIEEVWKGLAPPHSGSGRGIAARLDRLGEYPHPVVSDPLIRPVSDP
jgi:hypothetical protein